MSLGFVLLAWAFSNMNMKKLLFDIENANFFWVIIAMVCGLISHLARAVRWKLLLKPLGYNAAISNSFYAVIIGYFSNYLVPRLGEITRCATLSKTDNIPIEKLLGTVFVERIVDLIITAIITFLIVFLQFNLIKDFYNSSIQPLLNTSQTNGINVKIILLVSVVIITLIAYLFREKIKKLKVFKKIKSFAVGFSEGIKSILKLQNSLLFIAYSLLIWLMYFATAYFTFFTFQPTSNLSINAGMMVLFLGTVSIILPIPGGIGVFHKLVGSGLVLYGVSESDGITYATISHAVQMIMIFFAGLISMLLIGIKYGSKKSNL
ncbi:MAG: flippase-like domain-containing protein [Bacteroidetes bacterium]|nr:flippase-like domain-containing protein [Bacteroidota bacterium]